MVRVVHANWSDGRLHLWVEQARRLAQSAQPGPEDAAHPTDNGSSPNASAADGGPPLHAAAADPGALVQTLSASGIAASPGAIVARLPADEHSRPIPSPHLAHEVGRGVLSPALHASLVEFRLPTCAVDPVDAPAALQWLEDADDESRRLVSDDGDALDGDESASADPEGADPAAPTAPLVCAESVRYFAQAARFVRHLLAQERFVPCLQQEPDGSLRGLWQTWAADDPSAERLRRLSTAMPPAARAPVDAAAHHPWTILEDFLLRVGDAWVRRILAAERMIDTIDGRSESQDPHVAWLSGLLGEASALAPGARSQHEAVVRGVRTWIGGLETRGADSSWRLLFRLSEPLDLTGLPDLAPPDDRLIWTLSLHLQSVEQPAVIIDAADVWLLPTEVASVQGRRVDRPQEVLLAELSRAARLYKPLEAALENPDPSSLDLTTRQAYEFLREYKPLLAEQGFAVEAPRWWDAPAVRLGVRLRIESEPLEQALHGGMEGSAASGSPGARLGLDALVDYRWQVAVGDTVLSLEQFEQLAQQRSPLVLMNGQWVEIRPEDVRAAVQFMRENAGGQLELARALQLAFSADTRMTGVPVLGIEATGWVETMLTDAALNEKLPIVDAPPGFVGTLRPYQVKGLSWLAFLDRFRLGGCLADDMGLGKTIQMLALLLHERQPPAGSGGPAPTPAPTLLVVPTSVVVNWLRETQRFAPQVRVLVHHGPDRRQGESFLEAVARADLVITTYALSHRDAELLGSIRWGRIVLDEAQNVKNPQTKQARAIRSLDAPRRIALTGTPVENRLGELWSIMDFLMPGYLGSAGDFRRRFELPIERYNDNIRRSQLRALVRPFVLRRVKSDPTVIADLPEKIEGRVYCHLTPEQASLYEMVVRDMLAAADDAEGMRRRGIVLAGLTRLKQICNHPAQYLRDGGASPEPERSGKASRLVEMLEEVVAEGDQALVFTQFRQMGELLAAMLVRELDREVLLLHGGTPPRQRQEMIDAFQRGDGKCPVFILSLKAGGVGLNLTAASHVFHFDRWWNPAVEAQATDRAYRIGQTRTVQVHKFVVAGTLEERIDEMLQSKAELAEQIIGSGERWLTELSTTELRDLLTLRRDAVMDEPPVRRRSA